MDAKPMTPAEIAARLRAVTEEDAYAQPWTFGQRCIAGADCIDAQAAENTALRAERAALAARLAVPGGDGFTYQVRRAEWRIIRYNLDQYGMRQTGWDNEVLATWPTRELAVADLPTHGYEHKHITGRWIPHDKRHDYEGIAVMYREVVVPNLLTALRARVAGLEGALRPFADARKFVSDDLCDDCWLEPVSFQAVDYRRARAALSPPAAQEARDAE